MKVLLNEQGYVVSYALEGDLLDAVEAAEPADLSHFEEHFTAYRVQDGDLGGVDGCLYALIAFVLVAYITGVMCAIADKKLSSAVGFKGICRKVLIFVLVGIGNLVDVYVLGEGGALRTAVIFFYLSNEGISFLENAGHLGLPIPEKLKDVLEQLHDKGGNDNESA